MLFMKWMLTFAIYICVVQPICYSLTIQVEFEKTKVTPRENAGSVEMVLIANQTHTESFGVRVLYFTGTASPNKVNISSQLDVEFQPGRNRTTVVVGLVDNDVYDITPNHLNYRLSILHDAFVKIGPKATFQISIIDDEFYTVKVVSFPDFVTEGDDAAAVLVLDIQEPPGGSVVTRSITPLVRLSGGSAEINSDYRTPQVITSTHVTIPIVDDDVVENMEFVRVEIILLVSTNGSTDVILNIYDNDDLNVYIESNVYNAPESNQNLLISLAADGISEFPFIVTLQIDSGSANESDYSVFGNPPSVEFQPGSMKETLLLQILNDNIYEETQSFTLSISSTENERIHFQAENHTTVNILDNEEIFVGFTKPFYTAMENDGKVRVGLNIILPSGGIEVMVTFTVTITAMNGTAIDNSDYVSEIHQVQLDTNMPISEVEFQVIDDDIIEADENFTVKIIDIAPHVMIFNEMSSATIQIIDNDDVCPLDIIFLIDDSSSISGNQFKRLKNFLTNVVDSLDIGEDRVRVGVIKYAKGVKDEIRLDDFTTKGPLKRGIMRIKHERGGTRTGRAISRMVKAFQGGFGGRSDANKIGIVITDGKSKDSVAGPVRRAGREGITLYGIGIGRSIDRNEIRSIAGGDTGRTFYSTSFSVLGRVTQELTTALSC